MDSSDLSVWLEHQTALNPPALVAWVESKELTTLTYRVSVETSGAAGLSTVRQGGRLILQAHQPQVLGKVGVSSDKRVDCQISIALRQDNGNTSEYHFPCAG